MTRVALQPAASVDAREHLAATIDAPVPLTRLSGFVPEDVLSSIGETVSAPAIPTWGVRRGDRDRGLKRWAELSVGDLVLFAGQGSLFLSGVVVATARSELLAEQLWGRHKKGDTWECLYFLDELEGHSIPYTHLNAVVGYASGAVPQQFVVLEERRSELVLAAFGLWSRRHLPGPDTDVAGDLGFDPEEPFDIETITRRRREQAALRRALFGNQSVGACGICGSPLPIDLLVAAHIKRRSECSGEDRVERANILAMCALGCDALFERGHIGVDADGRLVGSGLSLMRSGVDGVQARYAPGWTPEAESFFAWHREHRMLGGEVAATGAEKDLAAAKQAARAAEA